MDYNKAASIYYNLFPNDYVTDLKTGWWFVDKNQQKNILKIYGKKYPCQLVWSISTILDKLVEKELQIYQSTHHPITDDQIKEYNAKIKQYKKYSKRCCSSSYAKGVISKLKLMYLTNDIKKHIDDNQYVLEWDGTCLLQRKRIIPKETVKR